MYFIFLILVDRYTIFREKEKNINNITNIPNLKRNKSIIFGVSVVYRHLFKTQY